MSAELTIVLLNLIIVVIAYISVYPKLAGNNINKVALYDCAASGFAIFIVATKYRGVGAEFEFLFMKLNWFWFTLVSYSVIEIPIALWYFKENLTNK
ncbi:MAG: hypothetical protein GY928_09025 [Colwellia sp.]|nr:hypothetical protein [Colwellia sp.]